MAARYSGSLAAIQGRVIWVRQLSSPQSSSSAARLPNAVPHFNLAPRGEPRSLCLFDLAQDEILRILTPYVLLERTRRWLRETAYGRPHGDDHPFSVILIPRALAR